MAAKRVRRSRRNRGGYLLARTGIEQTELARRLSVSPPTITYWTKGTTRPTKAKRELALQLFGIPVEAWDEPVEASGKLTPLAADATADPVDIPEGVRGKAASMEAYLTAELARIQSDAGATPKERLAVMEKCSAILERLGKITGEYEITTKKILGSIFFRQIVDRITEAAKPYPEAASAIAAALRRLEGE